MNRTDLLLAGALGGAVGIVIAMAVRLGMEIGSAAEWTGALGTIAALLYAGRSFRHQLESRSEDEGAQARREAKLVTIESRVSARGTQRSDDVEGWWEVHNGSNHDIRDAEVSVLLGDTVIQRERLTSPFNSGQRHRGTCVQSWSKGERPQGSILVLAEFTDQTGRHWHVDASGRLASA